MALAAAAVFAGGTHLDASAMLQENLFLQKLEGSTASVLLPQPQPTAMASLLADQSLSAPELTDSPDVAALLSSVGSLADADGASGAGREDLRALGEADKSRIRGNRRDPSGPAASAALGDAAWGGDARTQPSLVSSLAAPTSLASFVLSIGLTRAMQRRAAAEALPLDAPKPDRLGFAMDVLGGGVKRRQVAAELARRRALRAAKAARLAASATLSSLAVTASVAIVATGGAQGLDPGHADGFAAMDVPATKVELVAQVLPPPPPPPPVAVMAPTAAVVEETYSESEPTPRETWATEPSMASTAACTAASSRTSTSSGSARPPACSIASAAE
jgi:hypothetical protein